MKQMVIGSEAVKIKKQHKSPCDDCPFARAAVPGWLGEHTIGELLWIAHQEGSMDCHTRIFSKNKATECAGAAIYRRERMQAAEPR